MNRQWLATGLKLDALTPWSQRDQQGKADPQRLQAMSTQYHDLQMLTSRPKKGKG
ncbi:hypothetical protein ABBQ32_000354 [Trebouxia sp. C0010 RCD-2024]